MDGFSFGIIVEIGNPKRHLAYCGFGNMGKKLIQVFFREHWTNCLLETNPWSWIELYKHRFPTGRDSKIPTDDSELRDTSMQFQGCRLYFFLLGNLRWEYVSIFNGFRNVIGVDSSISQISSFNVNTCVTASGTYIVLDGSFSTKPYTRV